ncbi:MAG: NAD(P)-dependent oxidoreductase [Ferruginibacter sp.]|nr:NAD(P)-dependent oxidoreductase [Ferruginibacter sp.]
MKELKILVAETKDFSPETKVYLEDQFDVTLKDLSNQEVAEALNEYDVFWFRLKFNLTREVLTRSERCRYIVCPVTGLDHIDLTVCAEKGINVISLKGETDFLKEVRATAEHTIGLTLALLRSLPAAVNSVKKGIWNRDLFKGREIFGKKVGIVGVGRLGTITASFFKTFGADVSGFDVKPFASEICKPTNSLEELFGQNDIISIHVNLTESTKHLVTFRELQLMKTGSFLINTSRGNIVKGGDLIRALNEKIVMGAAVDVVESEYDIEQDELVKFAQHNDNLLITPHIGGNTWESFEKTEFFLAKKLVSFIQDNR